MDDYENKLANEAGLTNAGKNDEGEQQFIGTKRQWDKFERLSETKEYRQVEHDVWLK